MEAITYRLETFEGPLDLLLHLISKNKVDIKDIPISLILEQYLEYLGAASELNMELASEFIIMAAQLMYIKSKLLLPLHEETEEDPRAGLVEALLEYKRFKELSGVLNIRGELGRDLFVKPPEILEKTAVFTGTIEQLMRAFDDIFQRIERTQAPSAAAFSGIVARDPVLVSEKIGLIVDRLVRDGLAYFKKLLGEAASRADIVAVFLAILELSKAKKIWIEESGGDYLLTLMGE